MNFGMQDSVFPHYDQVKAEHVVPGVRSVLSQLHAEIDALEKDVVPSVRGALHKHVRSRVPSCAPHGSSCAGSL